MSELRNEGRGASSAPLLTLLLAAVATALWAWLPPQAAELLELNRHGWSAGELWRLFTGHLTHHSRDHLLFDLGAFVLLGSPCETRSPARTRWFLALGTVVVSLGVLLLEPGLASYRGLSGLDTGLLALLLVLSWKDAGRIPGTRHLLVGAVGALLILKLGYESLTDRTVFVDAVSGGFVAVPVAHWLGALVGLAVGLSRVPRLRADGWRITGPARGIHGR